MAQIKTGYPPFRLGNNKHAYDLGCQLLDLQDRLLVFHNNNQVRELLQLDEPDQVLTLVGTGLLGVTNTNVGSGKTEHWALRLAKTYIVRMEPLAVQLERSNAESF